MTPFLLLATILHVQGSAAPPCPASFPFAGETAMTPFAPDRFKWFKDKHKFGDIKHTDIRALGNGRNLLDYAICERLNTGFKGGFFNAPTTRRAYFRAGDYYLAVFVDGRDAQKHVLFHPHVIVLDDQLRYVTAIAPEVKLKKNALRRNGEAP